MTQHLTIQTKELEAILADLPLEKVQELLDFADYLRQRYAPPPQRGSAAAILTTLEEGGPAHFEEGELEQLLEEIESLRLMDMNGND